MNFLYEAYAVTWIIHIGYLTTLVRRAFRHTATPADMEWITGFYQEGRREGTFEDGIELALRRILLAVCLLLTNE